MFGLQWQGAANQDGQFIIELYVRLVYLLKFKLPRNSIY